MDTKDGALPQQSAQNELYGIKGWLILVAIGVVVAPIRLALIYVPLYYGIFTDGTFTVLTSVDSEAYHPLWGPLLIGEALFNTAMFLASACLMVLMFMKHHWFPKLFIIITVTSVVFIPFDAWLASFVLVDEPIFDADTTKEFARSVIATVIWVPYMLKSERVKVTFAKRTAPQSLPIAITAPKVYLQQK
ncbi:DUF2569 domain-containing protein [Alteromonas flava]|uniref:DUF2569 domain-containing protein n=1 Tax=Alteromonas flava TaxID=2048003 RepID=UPI000C283AAA|nr:DUF2569 domain-containing protein [Alteromonas flava]